MKRMQVPWSKRTRLIIILAAVAALLATILCLLLLGGNKWIKGGEDTPYPYSYQLQSNGAVRLRIREDTTGGYSWKVGETDEDYLLLSEPKVGKNTTEFVLTPQTTGPLSFTLQHRRESELPDGDYAFDFFLILTQGNKVDMFNGTGRALAPLRTRTSPSGYELYCASDKQAEMTLQFSVPTQLPCSWSLESYDEQLLWIEKEPTEDGGLNLLLRAVAPGTTDLRVVGRQPLKDEQTPSDQPGIIYSCRLTVDEQGTMSLADESFEESVGIIPTAAQLSQAAKASEWLGRELLAPEGAEAPQVSYSETMGGTPIVVLEFRAKDVFWQAIVTKEEYAQAYREELLGSLEEEPTQETVPLRSGTLQLLQAELVNVGFWQDAEGLAWCLTGAETTTPESIQTMADALWQANTPSSLGVSP